jgi:hypothetical protein
MIKAVTGYDKIIVMTENDDTVEVDKGRFMAKVKPYTII